MGMHDHFGVHVTHGRLGTIDLGRSDILHAVCDLALQIGKFDRVGINDPDRANPGSRQIHGKRRAKPARAHDQNPTALKFHLPRAANFPKDNVAGITLHFIFAEFEITHAVKLSCQAGLKVGCFWI